MNLNRAMIIGRLTRDPELRTIPSGQNVCTFSVATNRVYFDKEKQKKEEVEFHNIVAWGRLAEICGQYLAKGRQVYIEGRLQTREWQGQDGNRRNRTEIVTENMILLDSRGASAPTSSAPTAVGAAAQPSPAPASGVESAPSGEGEIQIEEIPF